MDKVDKDEAPSKVLEDSRRIEVECARLHHRRSLRQVLRRSLEKVCINGAHAPLRRRRLEVVDEVDDNETPSNILEEPRRRVRSNTCNCTIGGCCAGVAPQHGAAKERVYKAHPLLRRRRPKVVYKDNKNEAPVIALEVLHR